MWPPPVEGRKVGGRWGGAATPVCLATHTLWWRHDVRQRAPRLWLVFWHHPFVSSCGVVFHFVLPPGFSFIRSHRAAVFACGRSPGSVPVPPVHFRDRVPLCLLSFPVGTNNKSKWPVPAGTSHGSVLRRPPLLLTPVSLAPPLYNRCHSQLALHQWGTLGTEARQVYFCQGEVERFTRRSPSDSCSRPYSAPSPPPSIPSPPASSPVYAVKLK